MHNEDEITSSLLENIKELIKDVAEAPSLSIMEPLDLTYDEEVHRKQLELQSALIGYSMPIKNTNQEEYVEEEPCVEEEEPYEEEICSENEEEFRQSGSCEFISDEWGEEDNIEDYKESFDEVTKDEPVELLETMEEPAKVGISIIKDDKDRVYRI